MGHCEQHPSEEHLMEAIRSKKISPSPSEFAGVEVRGQKHQSYIYKKDTFHGSWQNKYNLSETQIQETFLGSPKETWSLNDWNWCQSRKLWYSDDGDAEQRRAEHPPLGHGTAFYQGSAACKQPPIPAVRAQGCNPNPLLSCRRVRINKEKVRINMRNMRKNFFPLRVTEPWPRLPREAVESPSLEIFKPRLDKVLCSLL